MTEITPKIEEATIAKLNAEADWYKSRKQSQDLQILDQEFKAENRRAEAEENNIFVFYFPVATQSAGMCMQTLGFWARREEGRDEENRKPFTIELSSPGGNVVAGFALIDYIREIRQRGFEVNTVGLGLVASMAAVVLQAGEKRILGKNSYLMIHELQSEFEGSLAEFQDQSKVLSRLNDRNYEILAERSNLSVATIRRRAKKMDWWLDAEEALKSGFVDEIH